MPGRSLIFCFSFVSLRDEHPISSSFTTYASAPSQKGYACVCADHSALEIGELVPRSLAHLMEPSFFFRALDKYEISLLVLRATIHRKVLNLWIVVRTVTIVGGRQAAIVRCQADFSRYV